MVHGLCGGVGFLYAVFEYKGHAPMLSVVLRSRSMPETYIEGVFDRIGAQRSVSKTSSTRVAAKALDQALEQRRPAVCVVDLAMLPHSRRPEQMEGMSPHYVGIVGSHGDQIWLDDRSLAPISIARAELDAARARYRKAKQELFTVMPSGRSVDWKRALTSAIQDTARTLQEGDPTVPASFRSNCGLAGMDKWRRLLIDAKDKKGWPRVFPDGSLALVGLRRAYDCIQHEYTAPRGGRPLYADFLDEAAGLTEDARLRDASQLFRESGERWQELADGIAGAPDDAVGQACHLADRRAEALDEGSLEELEKQLAEQPQACVLGADAASELYGQMAEKLGEIIEIETRAAEGLAEVN
jgi:hypothetical protein